MMYRLSNTSKKLTGSIDLTASKSESNRALIIQALCSDRFEITNLATAQDTQVLQQILKAEAESTASENHYDVGPAGTTMRFLTAYFAARPGTHVITGSDRMKKRPIGILVDALRSLGANITYLEKEGFAPLKIEGKTLKGGEVEIDGNVSSQFISALLLVSPAFQNGLVIKFKGEITSRPYINMTLKMLEEFGVYGVWQENSISVSKQKYTVEEDDFVYHVEGDWSAASYWYAFAALAEEADFTIRGLNHPSLQGDAIVADVFTFFGVKTEYIPDGIRITRTRIKDEHFGFDFSDCPDLAQTAALVTAGLQIPAFFNGLHTLRIKETDRIVALKNELSKIGVEVEILNDNSIKIKPEGAALRPEVIHTYDDHRMAMSFAALAMKVDHVTIEHPEVVKKSYPGFWNDLEKIGFTIEEI
ncbi:MAG: 3-phosphoshikimate 1-carboxyvinyltransferase [Bacteroidetes bacterium]|nr:3-phosphoshikimate 1-carboxyvinyltransferase [Bacteroidota bacterium]